jgi:hypothetical protein
MDSRLFVKVILTVERFGWIAWREFFNPRSNPHHVAFCAILNDLRGAWQSRGFVSCCKTYPRRAVTAAILDDEMRHGHFPSFSNNCRSVVYKREIALNQHAERALQFPRIQRMR